MDRRQGPEHLALANAFEEHVDSHDPLEGSACQSLIMELDLRRNLANCEACAVDTPRAAG
jgi:hypothetical protein